MAVLGYSPLPINLVKGGLLQVDHIPGHVPTPSLASLAGCHNPTFINGHNILLSTAPMPSACDKRGAPLNCTVVNGRATTPGGGARSARPSASAPAGGAITASPSTGTQAPAATATGQVTGVVVNVAANRASQTTFSVLTAAAIIAAVAVPPALGAWLRRRREQARG